MKTPIDFLKEKFSINENSDVNINQSVTGTTAQWMNLFIEADKMFKEQMRLSYCAGLFYDDDDYVSGLFEGKDETN